MCFVQVIAKIRVKKVYTFYFVVIWQIIMWDVYEMNKNNLFMVSRTISPFAVVRCAIFAINT